MHGKSQAIPLNKLSVYLRKKGSLNLNNKNINVEMINAGLAEDYRGKPPRGFDIGLYLKTEKRAREAKTGMWSLGDKYISPKDWRKR